MKLAWETKDIEMNISRHQEKDADTITLNCDVNFDSLAFTCFCFLLENVLDARFRKIMI